MLEVRGVFGPRTRKGLPASRTRTRSPGRRWGRCSARAYTGPAGRTCSTRLGPNTWRPLGYHAETLNVIGFDDGPFAREHRGRVLLVGTVCSGTRLDGVVSGHIQRDGTDSTRRIVQLVQHSQFCRHVQAVLLQGIAVGGFNVVDIHDLAELLRVGVLVVARKKPDMAAVRRALFSDDPPNRPRVRGASRKWRLIQAAGEVERLGPSRRALRRCAAGGQPVIDHRLWVQRAGLSLERARNIVLATTLHGNIPEPLRLAH